MQGKPLATGAMVGVGLVVGAPAAAEPIRLTIGGSYNAAYVVVFDDDADGEPGNEHNTDGFFQDTELRFAGSTVLDNGLEVGARIELEGETDEEQIDESWVYFSGGFGEARVGALDEVLAEMCVLPPGGTENFSAFSPNQWGANSLTTNAVCEGVDDEGGAQKIAYFTPIFAGFQLGLSYTPSGEKKSHADGVGPHVGMPVNADDESRHNVSIYGIYTYEAEDWGLTVGLGGSWEGNVEKVEADPNREESEVYQGGLSLDLGNFSVGATAAYFNDDDHFIATLENGDIVADRWVVGAGAVYEAEPWTIGVGYSFGRTDIDIRDSEDSRYTLQRGALTVAYELAAGIAIEGEVAYTRQDVQGPDFDPGSDDYDSLEVGLATAITF